MQTRQYLPEHWIDDGLLERVLGLFLPDHVNERDGGASLDDGGFDGLLKVYPAGRKVGLRRVLRPAFARCAPEVVRVTRHSAVRGTLCWRGRS